MLYHSFLHIPLIGETTEKRIWNSGVSSIDDFLRAPPSFLNKKLQMITNHVFLTKEKLETKDAGYFYSGLPSKDQWRLFREFRNRAAYLDIETTGLGAPGDIITTIALYDGKNIRYYVNGMNLNDFKRDIMEYDVIITYNGKCFDAPFIENYFGIRLFQAHLDLRYMLHSLGFRGGLKSCERQLGIGRKGSLVDVDGYFAVLLWNEYRRNHNYRALETLLSYNIEDVLNLEFLMIEVYNRKLKSIPLEIKRLGDSFAPENPCRIDPATVNRIKAQYMLF